MSKVLKVLSLSFLICLSLVIAPFHISANGSLSAPFVGYNVYIYDFDSMTYVQSYNVDLDDTNFKMTCSNMLSSGGCNTYQQTSNGDTTGTITLKYGSSVSNTIYKADIILDDNYVGYVNVTAFGQTKNWYVNGNMISFNWTDAQSNSQTITINSYNLTKSTSKDSMLWNIPSDSYLIQKYSLDNLELTDFASDYYASYPVYKVKQNDYIYKGFLYGGHYYLIFYADGNYWNFDRFKQYFTLEFVDSTTKAEYYMFNRSADTIYWANEGINIYYVDIYVTGGGSARIKYNWNRDMWYMPIYFGRTDTDVETDFALKYSYHDFSLSNRLLRDLHLIANGTSASQSSQSGLAQQTDNLDQSSNQLVTQEDAFNNDMNSALQNVDTDFNFGSNFGSKFIASADWVKTQYDRLTGSTPFGSVISFSLLIGLALLLVGKVFK